MVGMAETEMNLLADDARWPFWRHFLTALGVVLFFVAFDILDGKLFSGDPDDVLRAVEIRTLLEAGAWFDPSLPAIRMPDIYQSPWSRLVDLPYVLIAWLAAPAIGGQKALQLAFHVWPVVMAGLYALFVVSILRRIAPGRRELPISTLLAILIFSTYAIWEFSPGRIDHHNVQILLLLLMLYGALRWDFAGGLLTGIAASAAVAVGLETLPLVATVLLAPMAAWSAGATGSHRVLQAVGVGVAGGAVVLTVLLVPPAMYLVAQVDTFSAPYAAALMGFGLLAMILPALFPRDGLRIAGTAAFILLALTILLVIAWFYPKLMEGPLSAVTGLGKTFWYDRIHQEMPVTLFFRISDHRAIGLTALMLATLVLSFPAIWRNAEESRTPLLVLFAAAVAVVVLTLVFNRTLRLAASIVPLLLPLAIMTIRDVAAGRWHGTFRLGALGAVLAAAVGGFAMLYAIMPRGVPDFDAYDYLLMNGCEDEDMTAFAGLGAARIIAPPALGLGIIERGFPGVSVSTVPFHRAGPAISNLLSFYRAESPERRAALVEGFDYLALCRSPMHAPREAELPVFAALLAGEPVPGLVPLPSGGKILLFWIDHSGMR